MSKSLPNNYNTWTQFYDDIVNKKPDGVTLSNRYKLSFRQMGFDGKIKVTHYTMQHIKNMMFEEMLAARLTESQIAMINDPKHAKGDDLGDIIIKLRKVQR